MTIVDIARIAHEANRAYCQTIGDNSQVAWDVASPWQQDSIVNGVSFILGNPSSTPEDCHNEWCQHKTATGWTHGPVKDQQKKQHPCLLPYDQLPPEQRVKDSLILAVIGVLKDHIK